MQLTDRLRIKGQVKAKGYSGKQPLAYPVHFMNRLIMVSHSPRKRPRCYLRQSYRRYPQFHRR